MAGQRDGRFADVADGVFRKAHRRYRIEYLADPNPDRDPIEKRPMGIPAGSQGLVRRAGVILAAISLVVVVGNEICQRLVARDVIHNHLLFGYLSDLFAVPFTVGLTNALGTSRFYWLSPILFGILFSVLELEGTWDPWDMVCY